MSDQAKVCFCVYIYIYYTFYIIKDLVTVVRLSKASVTPLILHVKKSGNCWYNVRNDSVL